MFYIIKFVLDYKIMHILLNIDNTIGGGGASTKNQFYLLRSLSV